MTQRELSTLAGTGSGTLWDLENRRRGTYPKTIKRLCTVLGAAPAELMAEDRPEERG